MALSNGYGVVIGTVNRFFIEPPDHEGKWPHFKIYVNTPQGEYECAVNLKSRTQIKVESRDFRNVNRTYFQNVLSLSNGFHSLGQNSTSGALDVVRHPGLQDPYCAAKPPIFPFPPKQRLRCKCTQWWLENGLNLVKLMEFYLEGVNRIYIFGEPFETGLGIHNIHMNQGDPTNVPQSAENGIWQDGGLMFEYTGTQPRLSVMVTKFQTQSLKTDNNGHPIP